ncbi:hypothetical protein AVEN_79844-1 [Araneus ventricosus]|uniref:Uncharacterized protein n=1 Tax=Araneus ventricosus TaxID=182803 RepID=A0A4Y2MZ86_ARAVE|nr:hypothetical protein AVEN_79844-1 [Araneus ventricosus]
MAATKGNSNTALGSDSLVARAKPEKQKKNRKTKEVLESVPMGSADDFVVQKRSTTSGSVKPGVLRSTGLGQVPVFLGKLNGLLRLVNPTRLRCRRLFHQILGSENGAWAHMRIGRRVRVILGLDFPRAFPQVLLGGGHAFSWQPGCGSFNGVCWTGCHLAAVGGYGVGDAICCAGWSGRSSGAWGQTERQWYQDYLLPIFLITV